MRIAKIIQIKTLNKLKMVVNNQVFRSYNKFMMKCTRLIIHKKLIKTINHQTIIVNKKKRKRKKIKVVQMKKNLYKIRKKSKKGKETMKKRVTMRQKIE